MNDRIRYVTMQPYQIKTELGSSREERTFSVSSRGTVTHAGRPVPVGSLVSACNGDTYALTRTAAGSLAATYVGERQAVGLRDRPPVTLARDESGAWRMRRRDRSLGTPASAGRARLCPSMSPAGAGDWRAMRCGRLPGPRQSRTGSPRSRPTLYSPSAVAADSKGNLYVADRRNNRIRRIDRSGTITTFAGRGDKGFGGDGGPAAEALAGRADRSSGPSVRRHLCGGHREPPRAPHRCERKH